MSRWMGVREFLRGGYRSITEPTVVSNHQRPLFVVMPFTKSYPALIVAQETFTSQGKHAMVRPQQEE